MSQAKEKEEKNQELRLSKLMAERGICSRREADEYIQNGQVRVNGVVIDQLGSKVLPDVRIELDAEALKKQKKLVTVMLNKPIGYVSNLPEDGYEPAVVLLTAENFFELENSKINYHPTEKLIEPYRLNNLAAAGRLDIDSQGLMIFTQDGRIAKKIIGENTEVEKEYLVRVKGDLSKEGLKKLRHGLTLDEKPLKPAEVEWINDDQLRFVLREGKKRQIRRMCELVGLNVIGLKRVRVGQLRLGKLPEGQWRYLEPDEVI
jgi:23S rRNA pseudouridine2604 synthase